MINLHDPEWIGRLELLHEEVMKIDWRKVSVALATTSKGPEDAHAWARQVSVATRIIKLLGDLE